MTNKVCKLVVNVNFCNYFCKVIENVTIWKRLTIWIVGS